MSKIISILRVVVMAIGLLLVNTAWTIENATLEKQLIEAGWNHNAAKAVVALNSDWFEILQQEHPQDLAKQIYFLKNLGNYPHLMYMFEEHPETAALLAGAYEPDKFAQVLKDDDCYEIMTGLFAQHIAPKDATALAEALENNRSLICRVSERGLIGNQALFIFPRNNPGAQDYERWLHNVLDNVLTQPDTKKLSSLLELLFRQGSYLRGKMIEDENFRYTFVNELWPKLIRVANKTHQKLEAYLHDPHIWDLLALPQGDQLLEKWGDYSSLGLLPSEILFGNNAYPKYLHPLFIHAVLNDDENTLAAVLKFGRAPLFKHLLQRQLPLEFQNQIFNQLAKAGSNYPKELEYYTSMSDAALRRELGKEPSWLITVIPGYDIYSVISKVVDGRKVSYGDMAFAAWDAVDIALITVTLGGSMMSGATTTGQVAVGKSANVVANAGQAAVSESATVVSKACSFLPCDVVDVAKQLSQGKIPAGSQFLFAAIDVGGTLFPPLKMAKLLKPFVKAVVKTGIKKSTGLLAKQVIKKTGLQMTKELLKITSKKILEEVAMISAGQITKIATKITAKQMSKQIGKKLLKSGAKQMAKKLAEDVANDVVIEVTKIAADKVLQQFLTEGVKKVVKTGIKESGKIISEIVATQVATQMAKKIVVSHVAKKSTQAIIGGVVIGSMLTKELIRARPEQQTPLNVKQAVAEQASNIPPLTPWINLELFSKLLFGRITAIEITPLMRSFFKQARPALNRDTLKRIKGLKALLFMRPDSKVVVKLESENLNPKLRSFFSNTAEKAVIDTLFNLIATDDANNIESFEQMRQDAKQHAQLSWQQNISAWWLMNASGMTTNLD